MKDQIELTAEDWEEIYYSIAYKLTSPAIGRDQSWIGQMKEIMDKIGPDGEVAAQRGVSPAQE
jgi:hypothetical protein